jgi:RNA polymerase sigma-70 factor (ECF subfamily)
VPVTAPPEETAGPWLAGAASLSECVRLGDAAAEDHLAARFRPGLVVMLRFRTRDPEVAQELANDTLMAVIEALRAGKLREPDHLAAFVHGTARNLMNNHFRRQSATPKLEALEAHAARLPAADDRDQQERRGLVRRAIDELEGLDRRVLALTLIEDLKPGEIAARVGLSAEAVRMRKSRALRRVTERVGEWLRKPSAEPLKSSGRGL